MLGAALVALCSAACFAVCSVAQHRAAGRVEEFGALDPGLMLRLVRQRQWLLGSVADAAGITLQVVALGMGAVVVVQPLLVSGLLIAVPLSAALDHRRLHRDEVVGAALCVAGLLAFLLVAHPTPGRTAVSLRMAAGVVLTVAVLTGVLLTVAARRSAGRAVVLAAAAGVLYGLCAPLLRIVATHLDEPGLLLRSWPVYGLVVAGAAGFLLSQNAFQAGALPAPLACLTITEPLVAVAAGFALLHERVSARPGALVVDALVVLAVVTGVVLLARAAPAPPVGGCAPAAPVPVPPLVR